MCASVVRSSTARRHYCMFLNPNGTGASCYCPLSRIYFLQLFVQRRSRGSLQGMMHTKSVICLFPILLSYGLTVLTIQIENHLAGDIDPMQSLFQRLLPNVILPTQTSSSGLKTRHFKAIIHKLTTCLRIHNESVRVSVTSGIVSLEFTGKLNNERF